MAELEKLDPLDGAARSQAARILRESRIYKTSDGKPIALPAELTDKTEDWDVIFSAEAELLHQLGLADLKRRAPFVYEHYADVAGAEKAARRAANALDLTTCTDDELRADLLQVHSETARLFMTTFQVERERARLTRFVVYLGAGGLAAFILYIGLPFIFVQLEKAKYDAPKTMTLAAAVLTIAVLIVVYSWRRRGAKAAAAIVLFVALTSVGIARAQETKPAATATTSTDAKSGAKQQANPKTDNDAELPNLPIVPLVIIAGVLGASFSILQRVQRSTAADPLIALFQLRAARAQIYLSIVSGAIAALVVFAIFGGGMVEGSLFPKIVNGDTNDKSTWMMPLGKYLHGTGPQTHLDYGKLLVWAFIAGFAERFVPDILDKFTSSANKP